MEIPDINDLLGVSDVVGEIAKRKGRLRKEFSWKRRACLEDVHDIAWLLFIHNRIDESLMFARFLIQYVDLGFSYDSFHWYYVQSCAGLIVWIRGDENDEEKNRCRDILSRRFLQSRCERGILQLYLDHATHYAEAGQKQHEMHERLNAISEASVIRAICGEDERADSVRDENLRILCRHNGVQGHSVL